MCDIPETQATIKKILVNSKILTEYWSWSHRIKILSKDGKIINMNTGIKKANIFKEWLKLVFSLLKEISGKSTAEMLLDKIVNFPANW